MALGYLISPALQIDGTNGKPLTGGTLRVTRHGTSTPYITYKDFSGDRNPADVVLDAKGMAVLIADDGNLYDIYCKDRNGVDQWSRLNVCTIGSGSGGGGGGEYVGGTGIIVSGDTINVDTSAIQPILTAGDNISIADNTISAFDTTYTATEPVVIDGTDIQLHVGSGLSATSDGLSVDTSAIQTVLTFTDGLTDSAGVVSVDNPTPAPSGSDEGKVLGVVDSSGTIGWVSQPTFTQQNADWTATDGVQEILNKPDEKPMVAGSGITITEGSDSITIAAAGGIAEPTQDTTQVNWWTRNVNSSGTASWVAMPFNYFSMQTVWRSVSGTKADNVSYWGTDILIPDQVPVGSDIVCNVIFDVSVENLALGSYYTVMVDSIGAYRETGARSGTTALWNRSCIVTRSTVNGGQSCFDMTLPVDSRGTSIANWWHFELSGLPSAQADIVVSYRLNTIMGRAVDPAIKLGDIRANW